MIYVKRDEQQQIIDIRFSEKVGFIAGSLFDKDIKEFLNNQNNQKKVKEVLQNLDNDMVRIIEDVIDLLISKDLILFTDLPEPVQNKLMFKKSLRESLSSDQSFYEEEQLSF